MPTQPNVLNLLLERTYYPDGTNGDLSIDDVPYCHTIELPWKDNHNGTSCIPEGKYRVEKRTSEHHGDHLILTNTTPREFILIHPANDAIKELKGCIAPVTTITGHGKGSESKKVFEPLVKQVWKAIDEGKVVWITIKKK